MSHTSHFFDIEDAKKYGVDKAVLLSNLRFWLIKNAANESNGHDGYYWTYNSTKAFERLFPYWTSNKIQKDLKALEKLGVIKSGNYNRAGFDRTKWFTIPLEFPISQTAECNQPNGVIVSAKPLNGLSRSAEPIPDINTDITTDIYKGFDFTQWPEKPSENILTEWLVLRKRHKLSNSSIAFNTIGKQLSIAAQAGYTVDTCLCDWITSGWKTFKAEYMQSQGYQQKDSQINSHEQQRINDKAKRKLGIIR
jgi:hypothetical protein